MEHGVKTAWYANTPHGQYAMMECICGVEIDSSTRFWEETGREMDLHIEQAVKDNPPAS